MTVKICRHPTFRFVKDSKYGICTECGAQLQDVIKDAENPGIQEER